MAIDVNQLIDEVLAKEGGYVNHSADKGGPTNFGITQSTLSRYLECVVTIEEVKTLDIQTARDIYELRYYRNPRIDKLPEAIQHFAFDCAVNHGPRRAIKFIQHVCSEAGFGPLTTDGLMGPKTKANADSCLASMGNWMLTALVEERRMFYLKIVENRSSQQVFLKGWLNRANSFLPEIA